MNSRVQKIWLRLLSTPRGSRVPQIEKIEEGYYAAVCDAAGERGRDVDSEASDFCAAKSFIPHLSRTRAVYLNRAAAYGLGEAEPLHQWAGHLAKPVEQGVRHAFAIVDAKIFSRKISAALRTCGWKVKPIDVCLRVKEEKFTECANLPRAIVKMVFARSTFAEASRSLRNKLATRFLLDARLFARFEKRFAAYRPAVLDRYFTLESGCPNLAAGWDYWQVANHAAPDAIKIFDEAMNQFESLLAAPQLDQPAMQFADTGGQDNAHQQGDICVTGPLTWGAIPKV